MTVAPRVMMMVPTTAGPMPGPRSRKVGIGLVRKAS